MDTVDAKAKSNTECGAPKESSECSGVSGYAELPTLYRTQALLSAPKSISAGSAATNQSAAAPSLRKGDEPMKLKEWIALWQEV